MTLDQFTDFLNNFRKIQDSAHFLYKEVGIDLLESKHEIVTWASKMLDIAIEAKYGKQGLEWVEWFIFESGYSEGSPITGRKMEANDENGKPICYSIESLYEYLESNHKEK